MSRIAVIGGTIDILRSAADLGLEVVLIHQPGQAAPGSEQYCAEILFADFRDDYEAVEALVLERHQDRPFTRVLSLTENGLVPAARLNARLGLGGNSLETVRLLKNKTAMRRRLDELGLSPVRHHHAGSPQEVTDFLAEIGGPVVVKPVDGAGSIGVRRVDRAEEIPAVWEQLTALGRREALVEEYLEGPEFSVEGFSWEGEHHCVAITRKLLDDKFVEIGHSMSADLAPEQVAAVKELVRSFLTAVGLTEGPTHTELRLTPRGPRIIESHNRIGGARLHELIEFAYAIDITRMSVSVPLGLEPAPTAEPPAVGAAAIRYFLPEPGTVVRITGVEQVDVDESKLRLRLGKAVGDAVGPVRNSPERDAVGCYVIAYGADEADAIARAEAVLDQVHIATA